jgi:hypothetical protein
LLQRNRGVPQPIGWARQIERRSMISFPLLAGTTMGRRWCPRETPNKELVRDAPLPIQVPQPHWMAHAEIFFQHADRRRVDRRSRG